MTTLTLTRLLSATNRGAILRLLGIVAGVAVGMALFLTLWGTAAGMPERSERATWTRLPTDVTDVTETLNDRSGSLHDNEMAALPRIGYFRGRIINELAIAAPRGSTVELPGIDTPPGPGEYVASPALAELIDSVPDDQLGARYGERVGIIAPAGLEGPDALVVVTGHPIDGLDPAAFVVTEFQGYAYASQNYRTIAIIGALATMIPVLLLIAIVADLGAARRAESLATLRLLGATPRRVKLLAAIEIGVTTAIGVGLGVLLHQVLLPVIALVPVNSGRFYIEDLPVGPVTTAIACVVAVLAAVVVTARRIHRSDVGPLGHSRERQEPAPSPYRMLVAGAGLTGLAVTAVLAWRGTPLPYTDVLVVAGFLTVALGVLWAGPAVTRWVARGWRGRTGSAAAMIALNRIDQHPRAAFRTVSGLVIAVYLVSVFAAGISSAVDRQTVTDGPGRLASTTLVAHLGDGPGVGALAEVVDQLNAVTGVTGTAIGTLTEDGRVQLSSEYATLLGISAADGPVTVGFGYLSGAPADPQPATSDGSTATPAMLFVTTDGSSAAVERARTTLLTGDLALSFFGPTTRVDSAATGELAPERQYAVMAYTGIAIAVALSATALMVAGTASVLGRKRVLGLLRLMGMPTATVRRALTLEAAVPIVTVLVGAIGLGFLTAWLTVVGLTSGRRTIGWPDPGFWVAIGLCLVAMGGAVTATFGTARKVTEVTATRFD